MKKLIDFVTGFVAALALIFVFNFGADAGGWQFFDLSWRFESAIVNTFNGIKQVNVRTWKDFDDGSDVVQVTDEGGTVYLTSYNNVVLIHKS